MTTFYNENLMLTLKDLGLNENSSKIYLTCLSLGPSSILSISKASGVKRPTCYLILEELAWKGFASSSNDGKRVAYSVISPRQLSQVEERRHLRFQKTYEDLESIANKSSVKPKIRTFEGLAGIEQVFNLILELPKGNETYVFGANLLTGGYDDILENFVEKRIKKGLSSKALFPDIPENRTMLTARGNENRNLRFLPLDKFNPKTQVNIFGNTVAYIAHGEQEPFATVIESASLAHDEKQKFELLWQMAKE